MISWVLREVLRSSGLGRGDTPTPSSPRSPPNTVQLSPSLLQEQKLLTRTAYSSGWELFPKHLSIRHQERGTRLGTGGQEGLRFPQRQGCAPRRRGDATPARAVCLLGLFPICPQQGLRRARGSARPRREDKQTKDRQQRWALALILQLGLWLRPTTSCFICWGEGPESRGGEGMASRLSEGKTFWCVIAAREEREKQGLKKSCS